jgi:hypothetical protein
MISTNEKEKGEGQEIPKPLPEKGVEKANTRSNRSLESKLRSNDGGPQTRRRGKRKVEALATLETQKAEARRKYEAEISVRRLAASKV